MADYAYIDFSGNIMVIKTDPTPAELDVNSPTNTRNGVVTIQIAPVGFTDPIWSFNANDYIERPIIPEPPFRSLTGISAIFETYDAAGGLKITTSFADFAFDAVIRNTDSFVSANGPKTEFMVSLRGIYLVSYVVSVSITNNSGSSSIARFMLQQPGDVAFAEVPGTRTHGYHRGSSDGLDSMSCPFKVIELEAGAKFKLQARTTTVAGFSLANSSRISLVGI
jgi:hypothetical protein